MKSPNTLGAPSVRKAQTVYTNAQLQRDLQKGQEAQEELARIRQMNAERYRRWRARNLDLARAREVEYKRKKRAREQGQDPST